MVYGTPTDLKQIDAIIKKIDIVLAQVKIDVIITEVTLTDNQTSGLSSFGLGYSTLPNDSGKKGWNGRTAVAAMDGTETSPFTLSIDEYGFNSVFSVASQNSNIKILSAPSIVTTHNKKATINVSETQALITQTTSIETTNYPQTKNTVEWKDIGIILEVKPLIGENGVVQMEIKQTVESVVRTQLINDVSQPIIGKREAESFVSGGKRRNRDSWRSATDRNQQRPTAKSSCSPTSRSWDTSSNPIPKRWSAPSLSFLSARQW